MGCKLSSLCRFLNQLYVYCWHFFPDPTNNNEYKAKNMKLHELLEKYQNIITDSVIDIIKWQNTLK